MVVEVVVFVVVRVEVEVVEVGDNMYESRMERMTLGILLHMGWLLSCKLSERDYQKLKRCAILSFIWVDLTVIQLSC